jgi:uncharacterized protein YndB with AHSA1/START domain
MVDILHHVGVKTSSTDRVYDALTTVDGLAGWWTKNTRGTSEVGGTLDFRFEAGGFTMKVLELQRGKRVLWEVVDGPQEWVGTKVRFDLEQQGQYVAVFFEHEGWKAPSRFMHHCSSKWASFLFSLKALVETGKGAPHPNDVRIINDAQ